MPHPTNGTALGIFVALFALVTVLGFVASRWRRGDLTRLHEWGLGGRRFGTVVTWFLLGGDLYTAYTFIAVPALVFGVGAAGFFAVPYTIVLWPLVLLAAPRLWAVAHRRGYVTAADFVEGRYRSRGLALMVAFTGLLATMPYIALQLVGIQVVLAAMGVHGDWPLIIAFAVLAAYTYQSGLRAPALIAVVKDLLIYLTILVAVIYIPSKLGGYGHIFDAAGKALPHHHDPKPGSLIPGTTDAHTAYATLFIGSALALFLYPHAVTGTLSSRSANTVRRNASLLGAYTFLLALIALLGYMTIAAGITPNGGPNYAVPDLFLKYFPNWFVGVAFAAVAIGALVPAAIMSIAAANMFTRNMWRPYVRPALSGGQEAQVAKIVSLVVKVGALVFVIALPTKYAIDLQLLGGVWILQTLPALAIGLYTRWLDRRALLVGWLAGMVTGTWMAASLSFKSSVYNLDVGSIHLAAYHGAFALALNLVVAVVLTALLRMAGAGDSGDETEPSDYEERGHVVEREPLPSTPEEDRRAGRFEPARTPASR
jgi:SSS family solute:Na+ symporter